MLEIPGQPRLGSGGAVARTHLHTAIPEQVTAAAIDEGIGVTDRIVDPRDAGGRSRALVHGGVRPSWEQGSSVT